jgi:hypothetical protein
VVIALRRFGATYLSHLQVLRIQYSLIRDPRIWDTWQHVVEIPYRRFGTIEGGNDTLSQNVGKELPLYAT